jgi:hypothetical protein
MLDDMLANSPARQAFLRRAAGRQIAHERRTRVPVGGSYGPDAENGSQRATRAPAMLRGWPVVVISLCGAGHARGVWAAALVACGLMLAEAVNRHMSTSR